MLFIGQHNCAVFDANMHQPALGQFAKQQLFGQWLLDMLLNNPTQGPRAHFVVVTLFAQPVGGSGRQVDMHAPIQKLRFQLHDELFHDRADDTLAQRRKGNHRIQTVAEFRRKGALNRGGILTSALVAAKADGFLGRIGSPCVGCHDDNDVAMIPTETAERHNSVVGGASLWVLAGKSEEEYRGVAEYLKFIATPEEIKYFVSNTGYIAVTKSAFDSLTAEGFYAAAPYKGREVAIASLTATEPGPLNRGFRLGSMMQHRAEWLSEVQAALAGQKTVQEAYDTSVERGNALLEKFAKTYAGKTLP